MLYKRIWQNLNPCKTFFQRFSTVTNVESTIVEKKSKKVTRKYENATISSEIINRFKENNIESYLNFIPKKILRKSKKKKMSLYLTNSDVAESFCSFIADDLLKNTSHVIENNPGLGFLTEKLLKIGVPTVNLYEKNQSFLVSGSPLTNLFDTYKNRLNLKELCFTDVWLMAIRDNYQSENLSGTYLDDAPYCKWEDKPYAQIIMFLSDRTSLSMIIHNFFNQTSLFTHGRATFYITVPSIIWDRFNVLNDDSKNKRYYSQYNVLLNLFFDCQYFGELPRQQFLPWPISRVNAKVDELSIPMSIIKIEPKKDAYQVLKKEDIGPFWFFLKYCMRTSKNKVIRQIETLDPGFGIKLINKNIDITTSFKELPPQRLLEIFKMFRASPGYDESLFLPVEKQKIEEKEVEKVEEEDKQHPESIPEQKTSL